MDAFADLATEARNPASCDIDRQSTEDMLATMNREDARVAVAVGAEIPKIAQAVEAIAAAFARGGRLFYIGAGTSGRLGVLDASECPPTFNVPPEMVQGIIAGGEGALTRSSEGAEDDQEAGARDLMSRGFGANDIAVGIAASGRTPYVVGAVEAARMAGATTVGISCTPQSALARAVDIPITPLPGPEVLTGSTRLKAGTATKLVLNMLSTGSMIRHGLVRGNMMINVQPTNEKLTARALRIIGETAGIPFEQASEYLERANGSVPRAIALAEAARAQTD